MCSRLILSAGLRSRRSKDVNMSICSPSYQTTTQKPIGSYLGYFLYPRQIGEFVDKPYIEMTGKEMLQN